MVSGCEVCIGTRSIKRLLLLCGLGNSRRKGEVWSRIKDGLCVWKKEQQKRDVRELMCGPKSLNFLFS